jgi:hypothetical protein
MMAEVATRWVLAGIIDPVRAINPFDHLAAELSAEPASYARWWHNRPA